MLITRSHTLLSLAAATIALSLAGCGGGDASESASSPPVLGQNGAAKPDTQAMDEAITCNISGFASGMLKAVNDARAQPRSCGGTAYAAAAPLGWNLLLADAASAKATTMADAGALDGDSNADLIARVTEFGYEFNAVGENVGKGYTSTTKLMTAMLASPEHCKKIMSPVLTEVGAACVRSGSGTNYWTQTFGAHKSFN